MVETRRSSSASKRFCSSSSSPEPSSSSPRPTKRSKVKIDAAIESAAAAEPAGSSSASEVPIENQGPVSDPGSESGEPELGSSDPQGVDAEKPVLTDVPVMEISPEADANPEADVLATPAVAGEVVADGEKSKAGKKRAKAPWAKLLSQYSQNPHRIMRGPVFTVGRRGCDLSIKDQSMPSTLCELKQSDHGGPSVATLEITGNGVVVQVNGKCYQKSTCVHLRGGDEVIFTNFGRHAYIFQPLKDENLAAAPDRASSVSVCEARGAPLKGLHVETRAGDSSAADGASILASLSKYRNFHLLPPIAKSAKKQQNQEAPVVPSSCNDCVSDTEMNDADSNNDHADIASVEKTADANENLNADGSGLDPFQEAADGNAPGSGYEIRPILRLLGEPSSVDIRGISKLLDERREVRELLKEYDLSSTISTRRQAFNDSLREGVLSGQDIDVSLEDFPYFLSATTKDVLIASMYVHMEGGSKFAKYASDLSTTCPRILLSGPAGSEIYQEMLAKALAKRFGAKLMIVDSLLLPGGSPAKEAESSKDGSRRERLSMLAKRAVQAAQALQHKKPTSSVDADITGGSTLSSQALPKQEVSTATSKSYIFKAGDRVKYVGPSSSAISSLQGPPLRGPSIGFQGKVLLAFEDNCSSKVGIRFDRPVPDGNDLGGLCEEDHGFFCAATSLRLDGSSSDDADKLAVNEVFEVALSESEGGSLILFLKDIEKSLVGNSDVYATLKSKFENLPENIVVMASQTQLDSRKEKSHPGGFLFTKFGGNQTALLDLAFPDNFSKLHDRSKETPKSMKQITRLFPNKVAIQLPQDEALLSDWKEMPIQKSLNTGSVNRHSNSSAQCTLENLKPFLQRFPTLWSKLVTACFGEDISGNLLRTKARNVLSEYLNWRDSVFFSAARDTSLLQMLPCWFPKGVRRLVQLYIQGPLGWLSFSGYPTGEYLLHRGVEFFINVDDPTEISAVSWEAIIQKHIEEELHNTKTEGTELGLEHFLHRGRPLAAFNAFLEHRVEKIKLEDQSGSLIHGQRNMQSDVPMLLAPLTQNDESLLSSVIPLAITHFGDSVLVASCVFLLELCGLSASMLRIDVASLRRISSFYESNDNIAQQKSFKGSMFHAVSSEGDLMGSLARALANEYGYPDISSVSTKKHTPSSFSGAQPCLPLMLVLHHLEQASLPDIGVDRKTSGYWLLTGDGDGSELRSQQTSASLHWSLVTLFCQMHNIPLSTKYLAVLARDNDWVGFLSEAQLGGYPFDTVLSVASKEFGDQRLKAHILTVLRHANSKKKATISSSDDTSGGFTCSFSEDGAYVSAELFRVLAYSEKLNKPGDYLLSKAKELSWSILALIASCFPDVSPISCLTIWLEITAARETSSIKVNDITTKIAENIAAAVVSTNSLPTDARGVQFHYNRRNPKRRRLIAHTSVDSLASANSLSTSAGKTLYSHKTEAAEDEIAEDTSVTNDSSDEHASLSKMVAMLCEQRLFLPLLKAFELFLPSCSLLPFVRALQAFSQMRLSEASAHLGSFGARVKDESMHFQSNTAKEVNFGASWISKTAVKAADAVLSTCPSPYEKRCLLQLLAAIDFGDGGSAATYYRRLYWKVNLAEPSLRWENGLDLGSEALDDGSLLAALEKNRQWEQARNWAKQLETMGATWTSSVHHVTETQAESMVAEWKEFLWDVPEERIALWGHCQTLFVRYSFPALQAGLFFLRHAEAVEKDLPAREIYELLLLSLQWLSGLTTLSHPVYPLHLLREIETRVWLLAVEAEANVKNLGAFSPSSTRRDIANGNSSNLIDRTASIITKMDNHISSATKNKIGEKQDSRPPGQAHQRNQDTTTSVFGASTKSKRRAKGNVPQRRHFVDSSDRNIDSEDSPSLLNIKSEFQLQEESTGLEICLSKWEESIEPAELERAVLSLLEFGQVTAAKQLQLKLAPESLPSELIILDTVMKLAMFSTPCSQVPLSMLDDEVRSIIQSQNLKIDQPVIDPLQVLENLSNILNEGSGRGLARKIIAVIKAANILGLTFTEAYQKQTIELLRLLSLKAQDSFEEACLLVKTHSMPAASIAQILAESFLKGLLAAHRGGYIDSQKEEGPAPLLWRFSDFLKWAELCPSEQEIGHSLMRLVITGQEIPHACEVELLILSHHFYKSSTCLDGVDVLVALAATRVEAYVAEGDFSCLGRLITGVGNFHALNFILNILIENGQLDLLLQKFSSAADANTGTAQAVRSFRMAVLTSLNLFNPNDHDAFAMVYKHFDMKHETAALLEARADQAAQQWFRRYDKDENEDLLDSMRYYIEAAEVHTSIDAGNKARKACGQASLVSLQIRMPDSKWLCLSETNARRALVDQSRFQEALIVAEAYGLNQPSEWALVLWNLMLKPELAEEFVAEFVAVLPLQASMLLELARFYRAEMAARGDQSQFSVWLTGGGLPAEWAKYMWRSFRCLLKRTRDLRLRLQLATTATGFSDMVDACMNALDKVPDNAGPLVLKKGHGGGYLPLM